jgi:predicted HAD superfamily hydrolase
MLNRYEQSIIDNENLPIRLRSVLADTSRLCRLHGNEIETTKKTIWDVSTNVTAPLIFGFVHWVLTQAQTQGIQRLYFMARDGQILYKVAQIICCQWGFLIDCRYFYGSRQAFHFPAIESMGEQEFNWLFDNPGFLSIRIICERVNLQPVEIADVLARYGFLLDSWDKHLTEQQKSILKSVFQEESVTARILSMVAIYREQAVGYFKQEGMADGVPFATVDIGWSGKSQRSLSNLLAAGKIHPDTGLRGFFFGLLSSTQAFPSDQLIPYFLNVNDRSERYFLCDPQILELFMAGDHGSTVRYEKQNERYVPILRSEKNESGIAWGVLVQHQAVTDFAKYLTKNLEPQECKSEYFQMITENLLDKFIYSPSKDESEAFGKQPFSRHQTETRFYDLAPAYNLTDTFKIILDPDYVHSKKPSIDYNAIKLYQRSPTKFRLCQFCTGGITERK